jgi:hypothetical protein
MVPSGMKRALFSAIICLLSVFPAVCATSYNSVPVILNIHTNAGISETDAQDAIRRANEILRDAGFRLTVVGSNTNFSGNGIDANGDYVTPDPGDANTTKLIQKANNELSANTNAGGKGIKIFFVRTPETNVMTGYQLGTGWSIHRRPVVVARNRGNTNDTGQTLAHEFGHIMSLAAVGIIGTNGTNVIKSNGSGHAPNIAGTNGAGNLMAPSNFRNGTALTTNQIQEMNKEATNRSNRVVVPDSESSFNPPVQRGSTFFQLPIEPLHPKAYYTTAVYLSSADGSPALSGDFYLPDLLQRGAGLTLSLGFDTDNNQETGRQYGPFRGIDSAFETRIVWEPLSEVPNVSGRALDLRQDTNIIADPAPYLTSEVRVGDSDDLAPIPLEQTVHFIASKEALGIPIVATGNELIRVALFTEVHSTGTVIENGPEFTFDLKDWTRGPQMSVLFLNSTRSLGYNVSGLPPAQDIRILVDDFLVDSRVLSNSGEITGQFVMPAGTSAALPHFVTAQAANGAFATTVTPYRTPEIYAEVSANGAPRIRWERSFVPYTLESSQELNAPQWKPVLAQPSSAGDFFFIDLAPTEKSNFYRLRRQL